jgi:hypothetical protein
VFSNKKIDERYPAQPEDTTRTNPCVLAAVELKTLGYTDQTGRLT